MSLDDDYANSAHIPDGDSYYSRWESEAAAFRARHNDMDLGASYGGGARQVFDLFCPEGDAKGTMAFVHGGYWKAGSPDMFSHLAAGAVEAGYNCAMVGYTLAPDVRIEEITKEIATAVGEIASRTEGPLFLAGHSAGGHLVARMGCTDLAGDWIGRVKRIMPISPLSDLGPLMQTSMNDVLGLDVGEVARESPIHHDAPIVPVMVWVGGAERPVFLDQAKCLSEAWGCERVIDEGRHHFDVIEGLEDADSSLMKALLA